MKSTMKLCLIMASCISATAYSAERLNPDKIIRESFATGEHIDQATVHTLMQQQAVFLKQKEQDFSKSVIENYIAAEELIPTRIISIANPEAADLANQHNLKLQLHNKQLK